MTLKPTHTCLHTDVNMSDDLVKLIQKLTHLLFDTQATYCIGNITLLNVGLFCVSKPIIMEKIINKLFKLLLGCGKSNSIHFKTIDELFLKVINIAEQLEFKFYGKFTILHQKPYLMY